MATVNKKTPPNAPSQAPAAGGRLDAGYERQLAEEAEAGFDPSALVRRQVGRPSLPGRAGQSHRVDLRMDDETYAAIRRIADQDHRAVSDVVREAIRRYLEAS